MKKTENSRQFDRQWIAPYLVNRGEQSFRIQGSYLDEIGHNVKDHNGSEMGVMITPKAVYIGNDTDSMTFQQLIDNYCGQKPAGYRTQQTGFWGVGGSKKFVYKHGLISYHCSIEGGKYFYREFTYDGVTDMDFIPISQSVNGYSIQEYEISEEKYRELTFSDEFRTVPTWFICIDRYSDCTLGLRHNAEKIMKYLNSSFMNVVNFKGWLRVEGQKRQETKKVYYPTVLQKEDGEYFVPSHFSELNKVKSDWEIVPGAWVDIYFFETITEGKDGVKWVELSTRTNDGNDIYFTNNAGGRKQDPRHIYINNQDVTLVNQMVNTSINNDKAYYQNFIIKLVKGTMEYSTMKTSGINEDVHEQMVAFHKDWINENSQHNYSTSKGEDRKADDLKSICLDEEDTSIKNNLNTSLRFLSGKEIDEDITSEAQYWSVREPHCKRECDVIIQNEGFENIIHLELQNDKEDWRHVDGLTTRALAGVAKYNVLVVDEISSKTKKREYMKQVLDTSSTQNCWMVSYGDLIKGKTKSFVKIT